MPETAVTSAAEQIADIRREALAHRMSARDLDAQADELEHHANLQAARDEAAQAISPAREQAAARAADLEAARAAEREAEDRAADAIENARQTARRQAALRRARASAAEQTAAGVAVQVAGDVLADARTELAGATAAREGAESALAQARAEVYRREDALQQAEDALANPGRPPRSLLSLVADLNYYAHRTDSTPEEEDALRSMTRLLAARTGAATDIRAVALREAATGAESAARTEPVWIGRDGTAVANPLLARPPAAEPARHIG